MKQHPVQPVVEKKEVVKPETVEKKPVEVPKSEPAKGQIPEVKEGTASVKPAESTGTHGSIPVVSWQATIQ